MMVTRGMGKKYAKDWPWKVRRDTLGSLSGTGYSSHYF